MHMKERKEVLFVSFALIILIGVLNIWALNNFWYWVYWWFDILMHFLGGLWVGVMAIWVYYLSGLLGKPLITKKNVLILSFVSVLVVGIGWEVFEIFIKETINEPGFIIDTLGDLLFDLLGAFVAYRYFTYHFLENKHELFAYIKEYRKCIDYLFRV